MNLYAELKDMDQIVYNEELLDCAGQMFDYDNANKKRCPGCDSIVGKGWNIWKVCGVFELPGM